MEKEFWKNIPRYANQYQASTFGRIRRHPRMVDNNGTLCLKKGAIVTQSINARGLFRVRLFYGGKIHEELVHKLVAETFIPNKANQPFVRHKDGKLTNNHFSNLSWCSRLSVYSASRKKSKTLNSMAIVMNNGTTTRCYLSIKNAERRTGISASNICQVLRGKRKTAGGCSWSYKQ